MCAADKVSFVDTMYGTNLFALSAACTQRIVDGCKVVFNLDSAVRTGLLALHTADTAVSAVLTCKRALIVIGALYYNTGGVVNDLYDAVRTDARAPSATDTLGRVNVCDPVRDAYGVLRTNLCAVTVAKAGKRTALITAVRKVCRDTALVSVIIVLALYCVAGAVAGNVRYLFNDVSRFYSEDLRDLSCRAVTAGDTEVCCVCGLVGKCLSIAVASAVTARATVSAGQAVTDSNCGLIFLYTEENTCKGKYSCANHSDTCKK